MDKEMYHHAQDEALLGLSIYQSFALRDKDLRKTLTSEYTDNQAKNALLVAFTVAVTMIQNDQDLTQEKAIALIRKEIITEAGEED